jgi:hypothetical protein
MYMALSSAIISGTINHNFTNSDIAAIPEERAAGQASGFVRLKLKVCA